MAGKIIPAIATTNAMIAGLCILQAFKVLRSDYGGTREVSGIVFLHPFQALPININSNYFMVFRMNAKHDFPGIS